MPKLDFEAIKRAADIVAVIQARGVELKREGQDWIGLCPFHADKTPSLRVTPGKGLFRCMSCDATGNVIQFVAKKDGVTDKEAAVRLLASLPGVQTASAFAKATADRAQLEKKKTSSPVVVPPAVAAELLGRVAGFYHRTLFKADRAGLDYLASRHLTDTAMLEHFQVGYCNGTLKNALPSSGEIIAQLQALGVLNAKGNEVFYGRVVVPILDAQGGVVGLYGRAVEGAAAKLPADSARHIYLAGGHRATFNAAAARAATRVIFVESILDALSVWQSGERAVVALYGADGWTEHHEELVRTTEATELVLALDNDGKGHAATARLRAHLAPLAPRVAVRALAWPEGVKDANAFFSSRENAAAEFAALVAAAEPKPAAKEAKTAAMAGSASAFTATSAPASTAGEKKASLAPPEEKLEARAQGFALVWPLRRYEVLAVERVGAMRLKATVQAIGAEPGRFHVATLDLYNAKARRAFAAEAARLFRLAPELAERDLDKLLVAAEEHAAASAKPAAALVSEPQRVDALKLGRAVDLVAQLTRDVKKLGVVGEENNGVLLYLAMTSRKMEGPICVQILSPSGAGKSHLQDAVLSFCPEEDLLKLTALTDQALFYKGEDALRHKCLALEEVAGASGARYALRNLISAKKLTKEATITNPVTGKMETQTATVYGPVAAFETTTQPDTDPETKSRYWIIAVDESAAQTRAIAEKQRHGHTLETLVAKHERAAVLARHHAFQRVLRPLPVVNPYEPLLAYGDERLTTRRDQPKYLQLILAVAFLHQLQRPTKNHPVLGEYIEVTLDDIAIANDLALELLGAALDEASAPGRRLAEQLADYVGARAAEQKRGWEKVDFGRRELREVLKWSDTRLRVHLRELCELEYVAPLCGANGAAFRYRLLVAPEALRAGGRALPGIRSVEEVRAAANLAGLDRHPAGQNGHPAAKNLNLAGRNGHLAATSPVRSGEVENRVSPSENDCDGSDLAAFGGEEGGVINGNHR